MAGTPTGCRPTLTLNLAQKGAKGTDNSSQELSISPGTYFSATFLAAGLV